MTSISRIARRPAATRGLAAVLDFATGSHRRAAAVLVLLSLLAFLPGFFQIPPVDRDEARFAQATKQMLTSHDYVDIRFQDEVRYKKPVGIYWLQAAAVRTAEALGDSRALEQIWLYRIPSLLGATGAVLLTYWAALAFVSRRAALLAAVMMATSVLLGVEARLAKTDAMLLLAAVAVMGAMARAYLAAQRQQPVTGWLVPAVFWTALAGGVLLKGPVIVMFVVLTAAVLYWQDRSLRWVMTLRPVPGAVWLALLVLPWFVAIIGRAGDTFLVDSVERDLLAKVVSAQETHGAPPGLYFLLFWATFWPGATLAGLAAPAVWQSRREPATRFLLAWLIPSWIVFEAVVTKLPHYVLPLYPAIAILIAGTVDTWRLAQRRWMLVGTVWWLLFPALAVVAAVAASIIFGHSLRLVAWPFAAASLVFGLLAWRLYDTDGAERALLRAATASVLVAVTVYGLIVPSLAVMFPAVALGRIVHTTGACPDPQAAAVGYQEPSLVFLTGTRTLMTDGPGAADFLNQGPCRFALLDSRFERAFVQRADAIGLRYTPGGRVSGINISGGRQITVAVYHSDPTP